MRAKRLLIALAVIIGVASLTLFVLRHSISKKESPTIRIGYLPVAAELPLFVAVEQGYFNEAGIKVELIRFASSNELANAATADKVDILAGAASNVVFDTGFVSGKRHLLFAVNPYSNTPNHVTDHLIVGPKSGISSLAGLKGKKVASFPGSVNRIFTYLILEKHGIPRDSYQYSELLPPAWEPSLQSGAVDAVSALEPQATQILKDKSGISIFPGFYADLMPDVPLSAHWIAADFYSKADKQNLANFLNAYEKGIRFCREHSEQAKPYLTKYASVREDILTEVNLNPWKTLSEVDTKQYQAFIDLLYSNGAVQGKANISDYLLPDPRH